MNQDVCGNHALLQCLAEGTLASDEASAVKAHVAVCPSCRIAVGEYKQIMWDLEHPPEIELPPELEESYQALMEAWRTERQAAAAPKRARVWLPVAAPSAAAPSWMASLLALPSRVLSFRPLSSRTRSSLSLPSSWTAPSRNFLSWASKSVTWARVFPGVSSAGLLVRRTGGTLIQRAVPRWMRGKGGESH